MFLFLKILYPLYIGLFLLPKFALANLEKNVQEFLVNLPHCQGGYFTQSVGPAIYCYQIETITAQQPVNNIIGTLWWIKFSDVSDYVSSQIQNSTENAYSLDELKQHISYVNTTPLRFYGFQENGYILVGTLDIEHWKGIAYKDDADKTISNNTIGLVVQPEQKILASLYHYALHLDDNPLPHSPATLWNLSSTHLTRGVLYTADFLKSGNRIPGLSSFLLELIQKKYEEASQ